MTTWFRGILLGDSDWKVEEHDSRPAGGIGVKVGRTREQVLDEMLKTDIETVALYNKQIAQIRRNIELVKARAKKVAAASEEAKEATDAVQE